MVICSDVYFQIFLISMFASNLHFLKMPFLNNMWVGWVALHSVAQKGMKAKSERIEGSRGIHYTMYTIHIR